MHSRAEKLWIAGLTVAVLAAMELAGHITASVPPCIVDPAGYGSAGECPLLHQFALKHLADAAAVLREPHWLITLAAIVIGVSTLLWWRSTRRLMHATLDAAHAAKASAEALLISEQAQLVAVFEPGNIPQMLSELGRGDAGFGSQRIIVSFTVKNYGKTIALIKEISHELTHRKELPTHVRYVPIPNLPKERTLVAGATSEAIRLQHAGAALGERGDQHPRRRELPVAVGARGLRRRVRARARAPVRHALSRGPRLPAAPARGAG
jgi:hypothetical protein